MRDILGTQLAKRGSSISSRNQKSSAQHHPCTETTLLATVIYSTQKTPVAAKPERFDVLTTRSNKGVGDYTCVKEAMATVSKPK